jgi:hypothetical protein
VVWFFAEKADLLRIIERNCFELDFIPVFASVKSSSRLRSDLLKKFLNTLSLAFGLLAIGVLPDLEHASHGCAVAPRREEDVTISDEAALIVWDKDTQTEHFIRNAEFKTNSVDFGFLVPTPSVPTLHESGGRVLSELMERTAARIEYRPHYENEFRLFRPGTGLDLILNTFPGSAMTSNSAAPMAAAPVEVVGEFNVAGYDATILKASDASELLKWLEEHHYEARPELLEWLQVYTQQGWYLTAFRISKSEDGTPATAKPVRITFNTDRPFYPYREPADARAVSTTAASRTLKLFVLANERMDSFLGDSGSQPAKTVWANRLDHADQQFLNRILHGEQQSEENILTSSTMYLTEFEDNSSPRPGTDELFLKPSPNQSSLQRPPIVSTYPVSIYSPDIHKWIVWLGGFIVFTGFRIRRRFKRKSVQT